MKAFDRYSELLEHIARKGHRPEILGRAPDGSPLVSIETGGQKEPAIFISAGSHATEQAGVGAAVALIDELETDHRVYVLPCRDPVGLNGFAHAPWPEPG